MEVVTAVPVQPSFLYQPSKMLPSLMGVANLPDSNLVSAAKVPPSVTAREVFSESNPLLVEVGLAFDCNIKEIKSLEPK